MISRSAGSIIFTERVGHIWVSIRAHHGTSSRAGSIMFTEHVDNTVLHMNHMAALTEKNYSGCAGVGNHYIAHRLNGGHTWVSDGAHHGTSRRAGSIMFKERVDNTILHVHQMAALTLKNYSGCAGVGNHYIAHRLNGGFIWVSIGAHHMINRSAGSIIFTERVDNTVLHMHQMAGAGVSHSQSAQIIMYRTRARWSLSLKGNFQGKRRPKNVAHKWRVNGSPRLKVVKGGASYSQSIHTKPSFT